MKKLVAILITMLLLTTIVIGVMPFTYATDAIDNLGSFDTVNYGSYPQTLVSDENLIISLNELCDNYNWISYKFYSKNSNDTDFMWYQDIIFSGEKYRAVKLDKYRPESASGNTLESPVTTTLIKYQGKFELNTIYYFKYEPITWLVIDEENNILISKYVIDSQVYRNVYDNKVEDNCSDYSKSDIKSWIETDFMNCFTDSEKFVMLGNVGLIDKEVAINCFLGSTKITIATDYALITGTPYTLTNTGNCAYYWTGTINENSTTKDSIYITNYRGLSDAGSVINKTNGFRPYFQLDPRINEKRIIEYNIDGDTYITGFGYVGDEITLIEPPIKEGYTFIWEEYPTIMPNENISVSGNYVINKHSITYNIDGNEYLKIENVEFGSEINTLTPERKTGYSFSGWGTVPATMPDCDLVLNGTYSINKHKLIYKIDGEIISEEEVDFDAEITPLVAPNKEGYSFNGWQNLPTLMPDNDVVINGFYQKINTDSSTEHTHNFEIFTVNPTETQDGYTRKICKDCEYYETVSTTPATGIINSTKNAKVKALSGKTVNYRTNVIIKSEAINVPSGYYLAIYEGNNLLAKGDNKIVTYKINEMKSQKTYTVKVIDAKGNIQKDGNNQNLETSVTVKVNASFITKLVSFFKALFKKLPTVEIKP